jgi:hypothetical protein
VACCVLGRKVDNRDDRREYDGYGGSGDKLRPLAVPVGQEFFLGAMSWCRGLAGRQIIAGPEPGDEARFRTSASGLCRLRL